MRRTVIAAVAFLSVLGGLARSEVRRVRTDYPNIQSAIDASSHGDVVIVEPGIYYERIDFKGRNITVTSSDPNDPKIVSYSIINAEQTGPAVTFASGETPAAVLIGFTVTGGTGVLNPVYGGEQILWGAGIYCYQASPTIVGNVITGNHGPIVIPPDGIDTLISYGGGICCIESEAVIRNNVIRNNSAYVAGGILSYLAEPTITDNVIYYNSAALGGGVIMIGGELSNNTLVGNDASLGLEQERMAGNLYVVAEEPAGVSRIYNNIICNAPSGGGVFVEGADQFAEMFRYNNVWNNMPEDYTEGTQNMTGINGNISADPTFVNPQIHNYHLALGSPSINAGDPDFVPRPGQVDIDREVRIYAGRVDIGADEYVGYVGAVADAGFDQHVLAAGDMVTLDGTGSFFYDPNGLMLYRWRQIDGPAATLSDPNSPTPSFSPPAEGEYIFELVVQDELTTSDPDTVLVLVRENVPPVANAGPDMLAPIPGLVTLDGTASFDPDPPDRLSYRWTQAEGPAVVLEGADTAAPSFQSDTAGLYVFELVVSDGFEDSQPDRVTVTTANVTTNEYLLNVRGPTSGWQHYPDVSGGVVVSSYSNEFSDDFAWDILYRDFRAGGQGTFGGEGLDARPRVDGDIIVWYGGPLRPGSRGPINTSVFMASIAGGIEKPLRSHTDSSSYAHPAVSGNKVVWLQFDQLDLADPDNAWRNASYDICGADIADFDDPVYFTIATDVGRRAPYPVDAFELDYADVVDISGDIVVWEAQGDIYGADVSNLNDIKVFTICDDPEEQYDLAISGDLVVWTDRRNDAGDIYGADISDLSNITEFPITRAPGAQVQPAVDGCLVAYVEGGESGGLIRTVCLTAGRGVLQLPSSIHSGIGPALDGETLVWLIGTYLWPEGVTLEVAYTVPDGRVHNTISGEFYDFIQHAINQAMPHDEVVVGPGEYLEKLNFKGKALTVRSTDPSDPDVVDETTITSTGDIVTFALGEGQDSVLAGFTISGGNRGVLCDAASPTIRNCYITGHTGAGVKLRNSSNATISACDIVGNGGYGVDLWATRSGRVVKHNRADLSNCVIAGNARHGVFGSIPTIRNCTIVQNAFGGVSAVTPTISNSIVYFNGQDLGAPQITSSRDTVTYSDIQGGWAGLGNIDADPCFTDLGYWVDRGNADLEVQAGAPGALWVAGDYHLLSEGWCWDGNRGRWTWDAVTSPCIDAGNPACPLGAEALAVPRDPDNEWGKNVRINMGAYGGMPEAGLAPPHKVLLADIDNSRSVDFEDYALLTGAYANADPTPADLDRDGDLDLGDISLFAEDWLRPVGE